MATLKVWNGTQWVLANLVVDHGTLSGLLDDDHTQYIPVDGSRPFTATVGGVSPASSSDLTTKEYVDNISGYLTGQIGAGGGGYTDEQAQDAVGSILTDSSTIDFTYDDGANTISAITIDSAIDHDALNNFVGNEHIDHTSVSVTGYGALTGGGTIDSDQAIFLADTAVSPAAYGDGQNVATFTVDQQGRLTTAGESEILHDNLSDFVVNEHIDHSAVQVVAGGGLTGGGTIAATRHIGMDDLGVAGSAGSDNTVPVVTIDDYGRVTNLFGSSINHDNLFNFTPNEHIDHTAVSITGGGGLTGGGSIDSSREIGLEDLGVADTAGGASSSLSLTIDDYGRVTSLSSQSIEIGIGQVTSLFEYIQDSAASLIVAGTGLDADYNDAGNSLTINFHGSGAQIIDPTGDFEIANKNYVDTQDLFYASLNAIAFSTKADIGDFSGHTGNLNIHVDHTTVEVVAGGGMTGGGAIDSTKHIGLENLGVADTQGDASTAVVLTVDDYGRVTDLSTAAINHDSLSNFASNEHIDHTSVSVNGINGLTGSGTIDADINLGIDYARSVSGIFDQWSKYSIVSTDFWTDNVNDNTPFRGGGVNSGTSSQTVATSDLSGHPGCVMIRSSGSANSGYRWMSDTLHDHFTIGGIGGSRCALILKYKSSTNATTNFGFHDGNGFNRPSNGVYFRLQSGVLQGEFRNNGSTTTTSSSYSFTDDVWYKLEIIIGKDNNSADYIITTMDGTVVWSDSLSGGNYPETIRYLSIGVSMAESAGATQDIAVLDLMYYMIMGDDR